MHHQLRNRFETKTSFKRNLPGTDKTPADKQLIIEWADLRLAVKPLYTFTQWVKYGFNIRNWSRNGHCTNMTPFFPKVRL